MTIEHKKYTETSSSDEIQEIKSRLYFLPGYENVLLWKEMPVTSTFSFKILNDAIIQAVKDLDSFQFIIDRSETTNKPDSEERIIMREIVENIPNVKRLLFITNEGRLFHILAKFIIGKQLNKDISYYKTLEDAIKNIEKNI